MATKSDLLVTIEQLRAENNTLRFQLNELRTAKAVATSNKLSAYRAKLQRAKREAMTTGKTVVVH